MSYGIQNWIVPVLIISHIFEGVFTAGAVDKHINV